MTQSLSMFWSAVHFFVSQTAHVLSTLILGWFPNVVNVFFEPSLSNWMCTVCIRPMYCRMFLCVAEGNDDRTAIFSVSANSCIYFMHGHKLDRLYQAWLHGNSLQLVHILVLPRLLQWAISWLETKTNLTWLLGSLPGIFKTLHYYLNSKCNSPQ